MEANHARRGQPPLVLRLFPVFVLTYCRGTNQAVLLEPEVDASTKGPQADLTGAYHGVVSASLG